MIGASIAYACAIKGIAVVLKDTSIENAKKGKNYSQYILNKQLDNGLINQEKITKTLSLITPSIELNDLSGCEMVIETLLEKHELKTKVAKECESIIADNTIFVSNTSKLSISELAITLKKSKNFIGLHISHPLDKIQLIEIICGQHSSPRALAMCYDLSLQLDKIPIVINDSPDFYTTRLLTTYIKEGIAMLKNAPAASIENAAYLNGFPAGPLAVCDEISLPEIPQTHINTTSKKQEINSTAHPADEILNSMINKKRTGKENNAGFYQYPKEQQKHLWANLSAYQDNKANISLADIKDRLLFIMAIETVRCVEENILCWLCVAAMHSCRI